MTVAIAFLALFIGANTLASFGPKNDATRALYWVGSIAAYTCFLALALWLVNAAAKNREGQD